MYLLNRLPTFLLFISVLLTGIGSHVDNCLAVSDDSRSIHVKLKNDTGEDEDSVPLYKGTYALLIGVSKYNAGWPMLEAIPGELDRVEALLKERGFKVTKVIDPDGEKLASSFENFINKYGLEKENGLLFFFSGHGYTRDEGKKGYLVPVDAPDPASDLTGFLKKSLGMNQVLSWARDIEAKHALFLFDSCFSGTIFKQKSRVTPPRHITRLTIEPVRQFITAGSAGEEVPANSTFTPAFIDGLRYGLADLNKDGYVSATELGLYLQTEVPQHAEQNPQFGKIRDYDLSRGDFIFLTDATLETKDEKPQKLTPYNHADKVGLLKINSIPIGAAVYIDDKYQGASPITLNEVAPGMHSLRVEKDGYHHEKKQIQVSPGKSVTVEFPLIIKTVQGTLTVTTVPAGAAIKIVEYAAPYAPGIMVPAGDYTLEISQQGYHTENVKVQVKQNEDLFLNVTLRNLSGIIASDAKVPETTVAVVEERPAPPPPPVKKPDKVPNIPQKEKKIVQTKYPGIPADIIPLIDKLRSPKASEVRKAAKIISKKRIYNTALLDIIEEELLNGHLINLQDAVHIDAMSWLCNILGSSKNSKYKATLTKVSHSKTNDKLKKYALSNIRHLR